MPIVLKSLAGPVAVFSIDMADSSKAIGHVLVDRSGAPYGDANPLRIAPAILDVDFTDRSGSVAAAGQVALVVPANTARKGGWVRAPSSNAGSIRVAIRKPDNTAFTVTLEPGASLPFTVNPGYVLPHALAISGDHVGDTWEAVEFA